MFDALKRALGYRDLADKCQHVAATRLSIEFQNRYLRMAEHYSALAEADEEFALAHVNGC